MSENLFSSSWYRVAHLKPRIRSHGRFYRHLYRGQRWYILQDRTAGSCHRLNTSAYQLAGLMDGERTAQQIWDTAGELLGDDAPTQDDMIRLLGLLHFANVLRCEVSPDTLELFRRAGRRRSQEAWRRFTNPMSVRVPLFDPEKFLERWLPWVRPLFSRGAMAVWGLVVCVATVLAVTHWTDLAHAGGGRLLEPHNLLLMLITYPVVKAIHEFGHAFAVKVWGGEVHEMGITFLVLMPVPYVDASAASVFPNKWKRAAVGAAGIGVELLLASLALFVWLTVEPGVVRSIATNVMMICSVSTLLFNGNPLLRFDGYHVLGDVIEIPNLGARSNEYLGYLVLYYAFGLKSARYPVNARGEAPWLFGYGVASFFYRMLVMIGIALYLSSKFFIVGVLLAVWGVASQVLLPLMRHLRFLFTGPRLAENRLRAVLSTLAAAVALAGFVLLVPLPLRTNAQGVIWPPPGAEVRAGADGFVLRVLTPPGVPVEPGTPLILSRDPSLETEIAVLEAERDELRARRLAELCTDLVQAQNTVQEIATMEASLARAREREGAVVIRSPAHGMLVAPRLGDLVGQFLNHGQLVGYVVGETITTVRVVVPQSDIALVRDNTKDVEVRLSSRPRRILSASIRREVPAASNRLPSAALGVAGGGLLAVDATDPEGLRTPDAVFQLELALLEGAGARIGERVYVRFDHGSEPLVLRAFRALRRLLLRHIVV
jgi:putative peptide zinc metalloprotease protein